MAQPLHLQAPPLPAHLGGHIVKDGLADLEVHVAAAAVGGLRRRARHAAHHIKHLGGQPPRKLHQAHVGACS